MKSAFISLIGFFIFPFTICGQNDTLRLGNWYPKQMLEVINTTDSELFYQSTIPIEEIIFKENENGTDPVIYVRTVNFEPYMAQIIDKKLFRDRVCYEIKNIVYFLKVELPLENGKSASFEEFSRARYFLDYDMRSQKLFLLIRGKDFEKRIEFLWHKNIRLPG